MNIKVNRSNVMSQNLAFETANVPSLKKEKRVKGMCENFKRIYGGSFQKDMMGFLHRHPRGEVEHKVTKGHVIVDKPEWKEVRENYAKYKKAFDLCKDIVLRYEHGQVHECDARLDYKRAREIVNG